MRSTNIVSIIRGGRSGRIALVDSVLLRNVIGNIAGIETEVSAQVRQRKSSIHTNEESG